MRRVHEWQVAGQPNPLGTLEFPYYTHIWRDDRMYNAVGGIHGELVLTAEQAARQFIDSGNAKNWTDGPHLTHRTVTYTEWVKA